MLSLVMYNSQPEAKNVKFVGSADWTKCRLASLSRIFNWTDLSGGEYDGTLGLYTILFVTCVRFEESSSAWFITIRLHEVLSFIRALFIIMERQSAASFTSQSFRSDWAVPTGGVFDPVKKACFPSFSLPPSEDVEHKDNHDDEVNNESNGQNIIPA